MKHDPVTMLVAALERAGFDPRPTGRDSWASRCPAHNGSRHNLSVKRGDDGTALLFCHRQPSCSVEAIVASLGMTKADLFPSRNGRDHHGADGKTRATPLARPTPEAALAGPIRRFGQPTHSWTYQHLDGSDCFRVYRFDFENPRTREPDKAYRPVHVTREGWARGDPDGRLPLYRLPELVAASTVYVCEGEKAADEVRTLGLMATTSAHGAGSARRTDWSPLAGKRIVILPDQDTSGEAYARDVITELGKLDPAPDIKLVELPRLWKSDNPIPNGGDAYDWIRQGVPESWDPGQCREWLESVVALTSETRTVDSPRATDGTSCTYESTSAGECGDIPIVVPEWPAPLRDAAYHGLAGEIIRAIEPHTEADPAAMLVQLLVGFGNVIGKSPHIMVGSTRHGANEFAVIVGASSTSRKGTSLGEILPYLDSCDPGWKPRRVRGGLSTGEGLIYHVRDGTTKRESHKEGKGVTGYREVVDDPGVPDKRLFVAEGEFASVMKVMQRDGNTLSSILRNAWDETDLATLTKGSPLRATGAHISIVGHITLSELNRCLSATDLRNGFANRFLWIAARRSKVLPLGGQVPQAVVESLSARLKAAAAFGRKASKMDLSKDAEALWTAAYAGLTVGRHGVFGDVTSRAESHALRLALIYAVLDLSTGIGPEHLKAALALWDYSSRSSAYIFEDGVGDKDADAILEALRGSEDGLTRDEIRNRVFSRNMPSHRVGQKLRLLAQAGLAKSRKVSPQGRGRPAELWVACDPYAVNAEKASPNSTSPANYGVYSVDSRPDEVAPNGEVPDEEAAPPPDEFTEPPPNETADPGLDDDGEYF